MFPRLFVTRSKKTGEDSGTSAGEQELMSLGNLFMAACTGKYFSIGDRSKLSTFRNLWSNGLKECLELPHYNFGISIPSFAQREVLSTRKMEEGQYQEFG